MRDAHIFPPGIEQRICLCPDSASPGIEIHAAQAVLELFYMVCHAVNSLGRAEIQAPAVG